MGTTKAEKHTSNNCLANRIAECRKVLVVEDDPFVLQIISDIVAGIGYEVVTALNGTEALEIFGQIGNHVTLVVLDYGIPGIHPSRLLSIFREKNPEVRVIVSSGYSKKAIGEDFPIETIDGFVGKPFDSASLINQVNKAIPK